MQVNFQVTGKDRKKLAEAISEITGSPVVYKKAPTFAYEIGINFTIDKNGILHIEKNADQDEIRDLLTELDAMGYVTETETEPEPEEETAADILVIEIPTEGFTPETIDNLCKLVSSKEILIKKALCAEKLPIQVLGDRIAFPWFSIEADSAHISAFTQFITCLAETAKKKKRVTAKPQESYENEKFAMRVWLIGLGMIGKEYALVRKLLMQYLTGDGAWRYGKPEKAASQAETAPQEAEAATDAVTAPDAAHTALKPEVAVDAN